MLRDTGLFEYGDCIAKHWPDFGQNGKEDIKISDVCQHRSGLANFAEAPSIKDAWPENIKKDQMSSLIEKLKPYYPLLEKHGSKCEYHAITRGWITNEIIRRVDPKHRTMDEIFKEEVNIDGIHITVDEKAAKKMVSQTFTSPGFVIGQSMIPKWAGRKIEPNLFSFIRFMGEFISLQEDYKDYKIIEFVAAFSAMQSRGQPKWPAFAKEFEGKNFHSDLGDYSLSDDLLKSETASAFVKGNGRGCAKLASILAHKGEGLMSEKAWNEMHSEPRKELMGEMPNGKIRVNFTQGGVNKFIKFEDETEADKSLHENRYGYYGWIGYGGSIVQWHPELKIGFAFLPTLLNTTEMFNERGAVLQQLVVDCTKK